MGLFGGLIGGGPSKTADYDPGLGGHILGQFGNTGLLGDARAQYGYGPPVYDPNYRIQDFTGAEQAGQRSLLNYARNDIPSMMSLGMGGIQDILGSGGQAGMTLNQLMGGQGNAMLQQAGSGQLSPYYQGVLSGQMNDLSRQYQNTTGNIMDQMNTALGSADDAALLAGQYGGSRGEVARGIVGKEASKQMGLANQALSENMSQAMAGVLNDQFSGARNAQLTAGQSLLNSQLNAAQIGANNQLGALGMIPAMGEFGTQGGRLQTEVGGAQRSLLQAQLDEGKNQWDFNQNAPWANMGRYADLIAQLGPYMSMGAPTGGGSPLAGALGGAVSGFGLTGKPWGAAAGGIAGLLS